MPSIVNQNETSPIVHIEVQPSGSATMTFKDERFNGKVMDFHKPRDAEAHARAMGFQTITRKDNPEHFAVIPWYSPYGQKSWEMEGNS